METLYDVIIIGSGPAGLAAAIYARRACLESLVLEKEYMSGGQVLNTYEVDNYPGLPGIGGFDLGMKMKEHADQLGAVFVTGAVKAVRRESSIITVETAKATYRTKTMIIAAGAGHRKLGIPGEEKFAGRGVSYCATCDGAFFRGKTTAVVGGGDVAVEDAIFLARMCEKGYVVHRRHELRAAGSLQEKLFAQVVAALMERGLILKKGTIVDSTIISAPSSTKNKEKKRDPDAHQVKKGNTWHFGYKAHIGVDKDSGLVHTMEATSANVHDVAETSKLLTGEEEAVYGDSGYLGAEKRDDAIIRNEAGHKIKYRINRRPSQVKKLSKSGQYAAKKAEHAKSSVRAKVEHVFGVVKKQLRFRKTRYRGLEKQRAKFNIMFALANLILADRPCLAA